MKNQKLKRINIFEVTCGIMRKNMTKGIKSGERQYET